MLRIRTSLLLAAILLSVGGCGESVSEPEVSSEADPAFSAIEQLRNAVDEQRWSDAQSLVREALIETPGDAETLRLAADVAFANQQPSQAALFTVQASEADQFEDEALVQRAVLACIGTGQLYELVEFLEQVVVAFPGRHESRRLLFDFLVNMEDLHSALPHGRRLVRERQFDRVLLFSLSAYEQRDMEAQSMVELTKRNPDDPRLGIAEIRAKMDLGRWEGVEESLNEILDYQASNLPAQLLMGRYLAGSGQLDRLSE